MSLHAKLLALSLAIHSHENIVMRPCMLHCAQLSNSCTQQAWAEPEKLVHTTMALWSSITDRSWQPAMMQHAATPTACCCVDWWAALPMHGGQLQDVQQCLPIVRVPCLWATDLTYSSPLIGVGSSFGAVRAHVGFHNIFHHKGLLQDGPVEDLTLHSQLGLQPAGVGLCPDESSID